ncbi:MAG TPA: hypothetical protein VFU78_23305 [Thermomicrobiales bacterium]|nr:hypothetical protein [Thermomicrobiales bacterium]
MSRWTGSWRLLLVSCLLLACCLTMLPPQHAAAANERWCPAQTGFCAENAFVDFWHAVDLATNGRALEILGYPIDSTRRAPNGQVIQFYERAVMEWHPENQNMYQVLLTRLAANTIEGSPRLKQPAVPCVPGDQQCYIFTATQHTLRGSFYNYWTNGGGLPVFGLALTEEFQERNTANNQPYTVQYFERNRFEYHPEVADPRYRVLLGRLGAEYLAANAKQIQTWPVVATPNYGGVAPAPTPPPPAPGPSDSDKQLVATAFNLIDSVPDARYITNTLVNKHVQWAFDPSLPADVYGAFSNRDNAIYYSQIFRTMDPHDIAAVTGHEGQHAYDFYTNGPPRTTADCYVFEYRGFLAEASLWAIWYGPGGKARPLNDFEREQNAIMLDIFTNNGKRVQQFILQAYAEECGQQVAFAPSLQQSESVAFWTAALPAFVTALLPDADAQVAAIAGAAQNDRAAQAKPLPQWGKR